jgi:hypothetical protein
MDHHASSFAWRQMKRWAMVGDDNGNDDRMWRQFWHEWFGQGIQGS